MSQSHRVRRLLPFALSPALVLIGALTIPMIAHNVAVVHPEISDVAFETFRQADITANGGSGSLTDPCDECAYNELWEHRGMLDPPAAGDFDNSDNYISGNTAGSRQISDEYQLPAASVDFALIFPWRCESIPQPYSASAWGCPGRGRRPALQ